MRREAKRTGVFTRRALLLGAAQTAALGALAARLYQVQVVDGARFATMARNNRVSSRLIAPPRGRILDRFGTVLAGNRLNWRALLIPGEAARPDATLDTFARLVALPDHERARIERELAQRRRFIPVLVRDFLDWDEMARIEVNAPDLPGIVVDLGTTREYPAGSLLAHVVGYVAPPDQVEVAAVPLLALPGIRVGRAGMEKHDEIALRGHAGVVQFEVNALGRVVRELDREEGTAGAELGLTIDATLQRATMGHLGRQSASAVVLDATNGEVLAMATNPSFDPSLFNAGVSQAQWNAWMHDPMAPLINKAVGGVYPPGSTFKMAVALAALSSGALTAHDRLFCPGHLDIGSTRFHCWLRSGHGSLDLHGGIKNSCDVFFYKTALRTGIDRIAAMAHRLGLGVALPIELPGARTGLVPTRAWRTARGHPWNVGDTVVCGIGQGYVSVTPLQLATYVARVATGRAIEPHLTRTLGGAVQLGGATTDWPSLGIAEPFLHDVRSGMWAVVNEAGGTAPKARLSIPGVQMAGKTGSAEVTDVSRAVRESGRYNSMNLPWKLRPHALFVCYAPYDAPRYAAAVVVEHGNAGADVAGPIARAIMTDTLRRDPARRERRPQTVAAATSPA